MVRLLFRLDAVAWGLCLRLMPQFTREPKRLRLRRHRSRQWRATDFTRQKIMKCFNLA